MLVGAGHGEQRGCAVTDFDNDGWLDLFIGNETEINGGKEQHPCELYINNRDGTFSDVLPNAVPHTPWYSMGSDAGDINNDGLFDFMGTDMAARTEAGIDPRWTGMCSACTSSSPSAVNSAAEQSARSLMFGLKAARRRTAPISSATPVSREMRICSSAGLIW